MNHEVITHAKKDDVLELLGEQGEWFQIQLSGGHTGWVHRNVVTRLPQTEGLTGEMKRLDAKPLAPERISPLHLEPIKPLAMPIEYIPRPTPDELKIYAELELQLRGLQARSADERRASEQHVLQRTSEKFGISQELIWNTYLKVQGWEIKQ